MKAAVLYETNQPLVIEDLELDDPKQGEVLVKIGAVGICRSDRHFMLGHAPIDLPVVLGHEGAGTVEKTGPGVTSVQPGQQVILSYVSACGRCRSCIDGNSQLCDVHMAAGPNMLDGTCRLHKGQQYIHHLGKLACFAECAVVPEMAVVPVEAAIPMDKAALIGCCVPTGVGAAINNARVRPGSTVAVIGCGGVGLNVVMGAALMSAAKIIVVDVHQSHLEFAMKFGATHAVNAADEDAVAAVVKLTGGRGADYTFEAVGSANTIRDAYDMAGKSSTVTLVGIAPFGAEACLNAVDMIRMEKTVRGTYYGSTHSRVDMPKFAELYRLGKLNLDDLVVRHYSLDQVNEAYDDLDRGGIGRGVIVL